ncbi:conserved hypothetical protein [Leptospira interrogans serovar Manilae]|uniref:Uncharacterized protein n=1 Tax=Leptospira interrogans serovar Manilae TaxID=214675 RepID=A0AAQ1SNM9_LEPIR|nr:conserved hypothetical protein [Leptospira interrogans serovar Manilae]
MSAKGYNQKGIYNYTHILSHFCFSFFLTFTFLKLMHKKSPVFYRANPC